MAFSEQHGFESQEEIVLLTLSMALDRFPQEVAKSIYEKLHSEGVVNAYEASLGAYVKQKKGSDAAEATVKDIIKEVGVRGFMKKFCKTPDTSVVGIAYNFSLAGSEVLSEEEVPKSDKDGS